MDINGFNKLANMEHKQRVQSLPRVSEFGALNASTEPGWLLRPFLSLIAALRPAQTVEQPPCYECPPTLTQTPARR